MVDLDLNIVEVLQNGFVEKIVADAFGSAGTAAAAEMFRMLHDLYEFLPPDGLRAPLVLLHGPSVLGGDILPAAPTRLKMISDVAQNLLEGGTCLMVNLSEYLVWPGVPASPVEVSRLAVTYTFDNGTETIYAGGAKRILANPAPGYASVFARPTYSSLQSALDEYEARLARYSTCWILRDAWFDSARMSFVEKPERFMRRSLEQFLRSVLRASVRPEQNVDETHPVDIRVTWDGYGPVALIEIKWMGHSCNRSGKRTTTYSRARAKKGLKQLLDYVSAEQQSAPEHTVTGHYVLFDGRRKRVNFTSHPQKCSDSSEYRHSNVAFPPEQANSARLLGIKRMFLEAAGA